MVNFLDFEGTDPSSAANEAAEALTIARTAAKDRGITAFLFQASTAEEFDQRAEFSGVPEVLDEVADLYLGSPDQRAKLTAALRREFVAEKDPCGGCPSGSECVCTHGSCRCVKNASNQSGGSFEDKTALYRDDDDDEGEDVRPTGPKAFAVCPTCDGKGSHVNPSIDSQGLSAEDFDEDPDFREDYMSGAYDVPCAECGGKRVVPRCSAEGCPAPAEQRMRASYSRDHRDRSTGEHEDTCYDHASPEDKKERDDYYQGIAENEAELRMGA